MTREEITDSIEFGYDMIGTAGGNHCWTHKELENAMVAAYNKALEDAISIILKDDVSSLMQAESEIKNLKIV